MTQQGLTQYEAERRLKRQGLNQLPDRVDKSVLNIALQQFNSPFIYVLLAASLVSFSLGESLNAIFIFFVLLINAAIGSIQEHSAQRAASALRKMVPHYASVIRDGITQRIDASLLVPGDIVLLASGDRIAADLKLISCQDLLIDESLLTGESLAACKHVSEIHFNTNEEDSTANKAFAGTIVTHGRALGEVITTGLDTQLGQIAKGVSSDAQIKPPLLTRIERFTWKISLAILLIILLLFVITLARGEPLQQVFLMGVALAVSAIPEGLPAAITVALAIGMRRMANVGVIVRKLVAVESLGSCTYIASDKTGTLTVNELTIREIWLSNTQHIQITGEGLDVHGEFLSEKMPETAGSNPELIELIRCGALTNEAEFRLIDEVRHASGDGVDLSFLVLAEKAGFDQPDLLRQHPELQSIPYESENAFSASLNRIGQKVYVQVKGSLETVLPMCTADITGKPLDIALIHQEMNAMANRGLRVLACASKAADADTELGEQLESLRFLGLVGMIDPLRPEALDAVRQCRSARIEVAMITGDHPQTALVIARELEIAGPDTQAVTGTEIAAAIKEDELSQRPELHQALSRLVNSTRVFARIAPTQKLAIVQQLIRDGHFIAVTGDGVNDAPAIHNAHVGIAMGKRGTDVARESADLIITDDNFASIVDGIKQGRIVYSNIRKVIFLLISTGAAEIALFILSVLFALPIPLFPIQLLWLNLVTNGIQDVALAFEPEEGDELKQPPRPPKEPIFNRLMIERVVINAVAMGGLAFMVFAWQLSQGVSEESARNITLLLMVLFENVHVLNSRSETKSVFRISLLTNPFLILGMMAAQTIHIVAFFTPGLSDLLNVEPVSLQTWASLLSIALGLILVDVLYKLVHKRARGIN